MMPIFEKYTAMSAKQTKKGLILTHVLKLLGVTEFNEISKVEESWGSMWVTLEDGSVKSLTVVDCEPEKEE